MTKKRITILGGGMAALSAAYQLTKTQELRDQHDVTLYQMGWRLGGKAASGRDAQGRNLEHGLHVWFGFYENTFRLIQEIYAARQPATGWALPTWRDAVKPQNFTPVGIKSHSDQWSHWPLTWATNDGVPGDSTLLPSLAEMIETALDWVYLFLSGKEEPEPEAAKAAAGSVPADADVEAKPSSVIGAATSLLRRLPHLAAAEVEGTFHKVLGLVGWAHDAHGRTIAAGADRHSDEAITQQLLNIMLASIRGIVVDMIIPDAPFVALDDLEFRAWLLKHGAEADIVANSSIVRLIYDTAFQYVDGDVSQPNIAAGTAIGTILRIVATYKGSCIWEVQAGMGEVIVGPLYQHLCNAGVKFHFFHKVICVAPSASDSGAVGSIQLERQGLVVDGDYRPVTVRDGLILWSTEPDWSQLQDGEKMQEAGVNFESNWRDWPAAGPPVTLEQGQDFDVAILAIALGALKQLNPEDPSICQLLSSANTDFANWIDKIGIVPSMGVQLWSNQSTKALGWTKDKPATVCGPEYLNIWADMTQVLAFEPWLAPKPLSLHYLTGTFKTQLQNAPRSQTGTPALAAADLRTEVINWLNTKSATQWPKAQSGGQFDWAVLTAPTGTVGEARLDAQYLRANIDPTECCTLSAAGTTQYRLHAESGFANLILAGEGTAMGLVTSFEGAIMSGAAASRAICGQPAKIIGYDFLERKPSQGSS